MRRHALVTTAPALEISEAQLQGIPYGIRHSGYISIYMVREAGAQMEEAKKRVFNPRVETRLTRADIKRLDDAAKAAEKSRSDYVRQALLWYLDNQENLEHDARETEVARAMRYATDQHVKAINSGVERVCKMLARQGAAIGTLYELSWMALPDEESKEAFEAAGNIAKQKMRKHVEKDENELAASFKKVVTSP
jgi:hypothetical protein